MILLLLFFPFHCSVGNLVVNSDFEVAKLSGNWDGNGCEVELEDQTVHGGKFSLRAFNRTHITEGPSQNVHLKPGTRYVFSAYVNQLNDINDTLYQTYSAEIQYTFHLGSTHQIQYGILAKEPLINSMTGWFQLKGSVITPAGSRSFNEATLMIFGPDQDVEFVVDDIKLEEISEDKNWEADANARINKIRKSKIHFKTTIGSQLNPADISIQIQHKRHLFGFGTFVDPSRLSDSKYQQIFYNTFNSATIQASTRTGRLNQSNTLKTALQELKKNRIIVRGEKILSDSHGANYFIQSLTDISLNHTIQRVVNYMTKFSNGIITQWDVFDNLLDHYFFGKRNHDMTNSVQVYKLLNEADPDVKLFLNEYDVLEDGYKTNAYTELAKFLKTYGLGGIGVQSSYTKSPPDPTLLKLRLDGLGTAGLPVWITDFKVAPTNDATHADWFEKAMRLFFSHPSVDGVTVASFVDSQHIANNGVLFGGSNLQVTTTARRLIDLITTEWSTQATHKLSQGTSFTVNGFRGDYDLIVLRHGKVILQTEVHLGKSDVVYLLRITGNGTEISLQTTRPPLVLPSTTVSSVPHGTHNPLLTTGIQHYVGAGKSTADHTDLQCVTRWSNVSGTAEGARVDVWCSAGEALTGCSSVKKDVTGGDWNHKGEILARHRFTTVCRALNGVSSSTGVHAVARCCSVKGLSCTYRSSGPSQRIPGALTQTVCPDKHIVTGCMGSQYNSHLLGVYPNADGKGCLSENGGDIFGTMSAAACCDSPGLTCKTVTSTTSGLKQGSQISVKCNKGHIMTSCNGRSHSGKIAGAYAIDSLNGGMCVVFNGPDKSPGEEGVVAVAVCCSVGKNVPLIG